jgi:Rieske Fe-S protein
MRKLDLIPPASVDGCMTRRAVLATLAAAALTACSSTTVTAAARDSGTTDDGGADDAGIDDATASCASGTNAGALASFPPGTWKAVGAFIVGHDAGGLFAFSTTCTHRGCTVGAPTSTGATTCPCHGARFDGNGAVVQGPATTPLPHFALTVCDGKVFVDPTSQVAAATRTDAA